MPAQVLKWLLMASLGAVPGLAGCQNTVENQAPVYPVLSGTVELRWDFDLGGVASVRYELGDKTLGSGSDAARRFGLSFDTRTEPNGPKRLTVTALDVDGRLLRVFSSTVVIQNL
jgi:hypothetical protein